MAGIDKIVRQIEDDTKAVCDEMILKARAKSDDILSAAGIVALDDKGSYVLANPRNSLAAAFLDALSS